MLLKEPFEKVRIKEPYDHFLHYCFSLLFFFDNSHSVEGFLNL